MENDCLKDEERFLDLYRTASSTTPALDRIDILLYLISICDLKVDEKTRFEAEIEMSWILF